MKLFKSALTLSLLIVRKNSCINKNHFNFGNINASSWNPTLAIPLLKANVGVCNLFRATDSNAVRTNESSKIVSLFYQGKTISLKMDNRINLKDISTPDTLVGYSTPVSIAITLDTSLSEIESINLSTGQMTIKLTK